MSLTAQRLSGYLAQNGILTCNQNPYLPALEDIGCGWADVCALIDSHELFYCKAYRKRTTYLSPKVYFLLKQCRKPASMDENSRIIYDILNSGPALNTETIKGLFGLPPKEYAKAFNALLENMEITAVANGQVLNPSWSTFLYGTASAWEAHFKERPVSNDSEAELWGILSKTMNEKDFDRIIK